MVWLIDELKLTTLRYLIISWNSVLAIITNFWEIIKIYMFWSIFDKKRSAKQ